jgi:hypothetical protein
MRLQKSNINKNIKQKMQEISKREAARNSKEQQKQQ